MTERIHGRIHAPGRRVHGSGRLSRGGWRDRPSRRHRRGRGRRGYTLIEVMMAVGVMTVGAVGIMSLQQATTRGNRFARQMSVATDVTRSWVERLKRDAISWNQDGMAGVTTTTYLSGIDPDPASGEWTAPALGDGRAHDWQGGETEGTEARPIVYCTEYRLRWMTPMTGGIAGNAAIRADVRTWWHKSTSSLDDAASDGSILADCGDPDEVTTELNASNPRIHAVHGSTLLRRTRIPD